MKKVLVVSFRNKELTPLFNQISSDWSVTYCSTLKQVESYLLSVHFDFLLIDFISEDQFVPDLIKKLNTFNFCPPRFVFSEENSWCFERYCVKNGVLGFYRYPFDPFLLAFRIENVLKSLSNSVHEQKVYYGEPSQNQELIGNSKILNDIRKKIKLYASSLHPVSIFGESGVGKDLVARLIHQWSPFSLGIYEPINVSCIPQGLAESFFFGSVEGAFTDAKETKGVFERVNQGTLFLDEITTLDPVIQPKLLRVIEDFTVRPLGSGDSRTVRFKLVCASNIPIEHAVTEGKFREDLMYRIDYHRIEIPPLRKHLEDIPQIAAHTLKTQNKLLSAAALDKLNNYHWPGNVRQLIQCLSRASAETNDEIIYPEQIEF